MPLAQSSSTDEVVEETQVEAPDTAPEVSDSETSESSWDGLADSFEEAESGEFDDLTTEVEEETPPVEAEKEPEAAVEEEAAPSEEEKKEVPAPEATKEVVKEPEPPAQPQQTEAERQALRGQVVTQLAQQYQLSKEEAESFEVNPSEALPKFAAELHMRVYDDVVRSLTQQMPRLMDYHLQAKQESAKHEDAFYSSWPELKGYQKEVLQIAQMWRSMNPQADEAAAIQAIGKLATSALDIPRTSAAASEPPPSAPANVTRSTPPVAGSSSRANQNPFEALDAAWDVEDVD